MGLVTNQGYTVPEAAKNLGIYVGTLKKPEAEFHVPSTWVNVKEIIFGTSMFHPTHSFRSGEA